MATASQEANPHLAEASDSSPETDEPLSDLSRVTSAPAWSTFSHRWKLCLVVMGSLAAFLSPVTANIYYPAMATLSKDLHVSYDKLNLTITVYLIFQGLAPTFIGALSDSTGRRPAYILCFVIYLISNIGLASQSSFAALMVLRCIQSTGSSGTVTLGNAVVSDVVTSSERGTYIGYASIGVLLGPAMGPIIGGLLNEYLGWRSIFWFLAIFTLIVLVVFLIFLPETCRAVVGDGSHPPQKWNHPLLHYLKLYHHQHHHISSPASSLNNPPPPLAHLKRRKVNLLGTLQIIFAKEASVILLYSGLLFAGYYTIVASIPMVFTEHFHFDSLQIGLCYIPLGIGSMLSAVFSGRALDWNFARHARKLGIPIKAGRQTNMQNFPIEKVRLQIIIPLVGVATIFILMYGWILEETDSLAGTLVILFLMGGCISGAFSVLNTLMVDLYPLSPGTSTAAANLVRCWLGACAVAAIGPILTRIGTGWVSVCVMGLWVGFSPILWIVLRWGPGWREEKRVRDEERRTKEEQEEMDEEGAGGEGQGEKDSGVVTE